MIPSILLFHYLCYISLLFFTADSISTLTTHGKIEDFLQQVADVINRPGDDFLLVILLKLVVEDLRDHFVDDTAAKFLVGKNHRLGTVPARAGSPARRRERWSRGHGRSLTNQRLVGVVMIMARKRGHGLTMAYERLGGVIMVFHEPVSAMTRNSIYSFFAKFSSKENSQKILNRLPNSLFFPTECSFACC